MKWGLKGTSRLVLHVVRVERTPDARAKSRTLPPASVVERQGLAVAVVGNKHLNKISKCIIIDYVNNIICQS